MARPVRIPFMPAGPFIALKAATIGGVEVGHLELVEASRIEHIGERKLRLMYDGRWIDMASPEQIEAAGLVAAGHMDPIATLAAEASRDAIAATIVNDPLAGTGEGIQIAPGTQADGTPSEPVRTAPADDDTPPAVFGTARLPAMVLVGEVEMQLGRIVASALAKSGLSNADWNDLEEGYRDSLVLDRAREIGWTGEPLPVPAQDGAGAPPAPPAGDDTPPPANEPPAPPPAAPAPAAQSGVAVAVMHEGFGRWYKVDAAFAHVGSKMTKAQAEATGLPVVDKPKAHGDD